MSLAEQVPSGTELAWRRFIETSARLSTAVDDELRRDGGMTLADYHVLLLLTEAPEGRLRMKEIAQRMVFSASRLTYQMDQLCKRGWLRREAVAEDRRGSYAALTPEGRAAFAAAAAGHRALVTELFFDVLSPEQASHLVAAMDVLATQLDERTKP
ncbi:MAG: MarR family transcriptional regulator [Nocardioides sp.]